MSPEYLTPEEVADLLRASAKSVYRWAAEDPTMPCLRIGGSKRGKVLFPRDRLMTWLRQREQGSGQPRSRKLLLRTDVSQGSTALNGSCAAPCAETGPDR